MSKRTTFTTISPLPAGVSREAVLDFLHNHLEMIDLNPLIRERHVIDPPAHAPPEEHSCVWYSLTDEISYLPGGLATGNVSYTCAFHNLPTGLQTHCYAPMGLEIRDKWTVAGSLPGEPVEPVELGIGAPITGLYLREDIDMRCNVFTTSFVKKTLKKSHGMLVDRIKSKIQETSTPSPHQKHQNHQLPSAYTSYQPLPMHARHGSQNSVSSFDSTSSRGSAPRHDHHRAPSYGSLGNQINLPYRPSYPRSTPPPPSDGSPGAYPEPLRTRHAQKPSWSGIKTQYTHKKNYSDYSTDPYDHKPLPPAPYESDIPAGGAGQRSGPHPTGPFIAELE